MQIQSRETSRPRWLLTVASLVMTSWAMAQGDNQHGIHVTGAGEIIAVPDMATVSLEVTRIGPRAAALKSELDKVTAAVIRLAQRHGVDAKDITAAAVQIYPNRQYQDGRQTIDGVVASRSLSIVVRELDKLGDITNEALEAGVNTIGQIRLDTSERPELEDRALDLAVSDARRVAKRLASGFDVQLGRAYDVRTIGTRSVRPEVNARALAASTDESVSAGEMTIRREVQVSFSILGANQ
ncbi:MAG: SIMPL domain-containing protein [Pseudomonadota bacterium]